MPETDVTPVFTDTKEREIEEKTKKLIEQKMSEIEEAKKKQQMADRITQIKDTIKKSEEIVKKEEKPPEKVPEKLKEMEVCPTCKGHTLHVHENIAKCDGPNCGKEFLLQERSDKRKDYFCTTCGYALTKDEATALKEKSCPMCNKGKKLLDFDWNFIDETMKKKGIKKVEIK